MPVKSVSQSAMKTISRLSLRWLSGVSLPPGMMMSAPYASFNFRRADRVALDVLPNSAINFASSGELAGMGITRPECLSLADPGR